MITVAFGPQRLPFFATVFLHDHGPQEWCNEQYRQQSGNHVANSHGVSQKRNVVRQQLAHERIANHEHQYNDGSREYGIDNDVD